MKNAFLTNRNYLPVEEYEKLDVAMSIYNTYNPYMFYCAIYTEGVIIILAESPFFNHIEKTKNDFPNLYKLIEYANDEDVTYIELAIYGANLSEDSEKKYNLKSFSW